jgi:hypothetical protein
MVAANEEQLSEGRAVVVLYLSLWFAVPYSFVAEFSILALLLQN